MTRYLHEPPTISAALHEPAARAEGVARRGQRLAAVAANCEVLGCGGSGLGQDEVNADEMLLELDQLCTKVSG